MPIQYIAGQLSFSSQPSRFADIFLFWVLFYAHLMTRKAAYILRPRIYFAFLCNSNLAPRRR
jgi:hypothetical protein